MSYPSSCASSSAVESNIFATRKYFLWVRCTDEWSTSEGCESNHFAVAWCRGWRIVLDFSSVVWLCVRARTSAISSAASSGANVTLACAKTIDSPESKFSPSLPDSSQATTKGVTGITAPRPLADPSRSPRLSRLRATPLWQCSTTRPERTAPGELSLWRQLPGDSGQFKWYHSPTTLCAGNFERRGANLKGLLAGSPLHEPVLCGPERSRGRSVVRPRCEQAAFDVDDFNMESMHLGPGPIELEDVGSQQRLECALRGLGHHLELLGSLSGVEAPVDQHRCARVPAERLSTSNLDLDVDIEREVHLSCLPRQRSAVSLAVRVR